MPRTGLTEQLDRRRLGWHAEVGERGAAGLERGTGCSSVAVGEVRAGEEPVGVHRSSPRLASAAAALLLAAACGGTRVTTVGESGAPAATPSASAHRSADALERWAPAGSAVTVSADAAERRLADAGDRGCRSLTSADAIERCLASP